MNALNETSPGMLLFTGTFQHIGLTKRQQKMKLAI